MPIGLKLKDGTQHNFSRDILKSICEEDISKAKSLTKKKYRVENWFRSSWVGKLFGTKTLESIVEEIYDNVHSNKINPSSANKLGDNRKSVISELHNTIIDKKTNNIDKFIAFSNIQKLAIQEDRQYFKVQFSSDQDGQQKIDFSIKAKPGLFSRFFSSNASDSCLPIYNGEVNKIEKQIIEKYVDVANQSIDRRDNVTDDDIRNDYDKLKSRSEKLDSLFSLIEKKIKIKRIREQIEDLNKTEQVKSHFTEFSEHIVKQNQITILKNIKEQRKKQIQKATKIQSIFRSFHMKSPLLKKLIDEHTFSKVEDLQNHVTYKKLSEYQRVEIEKYFQDYASQQAVVKGFLESIDKNNYQSTRDLKLNFIKLSSKNKLLITDYLDKHIENQNSKFNEFISGKYQDFATIEELKSNQEFISLFGFQQEDILNNVEIQKYYDKQGEYYKRFVEIIDNRDPMGDRLTINDKTEEIEDVVDMNHANLHKAYIYYKEDMKKQQQIKNQILFDLIYGKADIKDNYDDLNLSFKIKKDLNDAIEKIKVKKSEILEQFDNKFYLEQIYLKEGEVLNHFLDLKSSKVKLSTKEKELVIKRYQLLKKKCDEYLLNVKTYIRAHHFEKIDTISSSNVVGYEPDKWGNFNDKHALNVEMFPKVIQQKVKECWYCYEKHQNTLIDNILKQYKNRPQFKKQDKLCDFIVDTDVSDFFTKDDLVTLYCIDRNDINSIKKQNIGELLSVVNLNKLADKINENEKAIAYKNEVRELREILNENRAEYLIYPDCNRVKGNFNEKDIKKYNWVTSSKRDKNLSMIYNKNINEYAKENLGITACQQYLFSDQWASYIGDHFKKCFGDEVSINYNELKVNFEYVKSDRVAKYDMHVLASVEIKGYGLVDFDISCFTLEINIDNPVNGFPDSFDLKYNPDGYIKYINPISQLEEILNLKTKTI